MPAPPHPPWWATAAPSPRDLCQAEKLPQSSEGQSREKQISIKHSVPGPHQAFVPCLSYPRPSPGQLLVGRGLRTGGLLDFRVQGEQRGVGHTSAPLVFRSLSLSWGRRSGTPPSPVVPRGMPVVPCGPLGKRVWKSCGVQEPCQGGE